MRLFQLSMSLPTGEEQATDAWLRSRCRSMPCVGTSVWRRGGAPEVNHARDSLTTELRYDSRGNQLSAEHVHVVPGQGLLI